MIMLPELKYLLELARTLNNATRQGTEKDEPEGTRFIVISDTLARNIARELVLSADAIQQVVNNTIAVADSDAARRFVGKP